jgi:hypothetical protein
LLERDHTHQEQDGERCGEAGRHQALGRKIFDVLHGVDVMSEQ